jgi:hypothetical protein
MVQTFAENANNDLTRDSNGNIALLSGVAAIEQLCVDIMETQLGEMPLATTMGVPTKATIWDYWKPDQFEVVARAALLSVEGVTGVTQFNLTRSQGVATYIATVTTIYDPITFNGTLSQ